MKERRYAKYYKIAIRVDPATGREREERVYTGPLYGPAPARREKAALFLLTLLWWAFMVLGLLTDAPGTRNLYSGPFMAFTAVPGAYALLGLWETARLSDRMTIVARESSLGRVTRSALGCAVLGGACLVGEAVFLCLGGAGDRLGEELTFAAFCALACLCAGALLGLARRLYRAAEEK